MGLKTLVKVSEVNNLSDARYCAGMGVEMIGFSLDENHPKFIELAKLREISIWISGIKVVGEFAGENTENMNYLAKELNLDYIQLNIAIKTDAIKTLNKPVILQVNLDNYSKTEIDTLLETYKETVTYFLLESEKENTVSGTSDYLKKWCENYPVILGFGINIEDMDSILNNLKPSGIGLKGGEEIKPGLKTFDELSSILELLEQED